MMPRRFTLGLVGILMALGCGHIWTPETDTDGGGLEVRSPSRGAVTVLSSALRLDRLKGVWMRGEVPFTGHGIHLWPDGSLKERTSFVEGRRHGLREHFFPSGLLSARTPYEDGRRHGVAFTWWDNGRLRSESHLEMGHPEGVQTQWYSSGALFKVIRIVDGQESGLQQAWRENGSIYNNYEARNGRIYGLRRSKLCFDLSDEELLP